MNVWLCIEPSAGGPRISNLPGGPNHCYITGKFDTSGKAIHYPSCGEYQLAPLDARIVGAEALVIERDADGKWAEWALNALDARPYSSKSILDALAEARRHE